MKIQIEPNIVFRVPQFSYRTDLIANWPALKASIKHASPNFFDLIKDVAADELHLLAPGLYNTIWKYHNRACYRATPFGSFAGIGITKLNYKYESPLTVTADQILHSYPCWTAMQRDKISIEDLLRENVSLIVNHSNYSIGNEVRYIGRFDRGFELSDFELDDPCRTIIEKCQLPIRIGQLFKELNTSYGEEEIKQALDLLIEDQLIFTDKQPNLLGEDYFDRISATGSITAPSYLIAERKNNGGTIDGTQFKNLPAMVAHLHALLPSYSSPELDLFIDRFLKKFGQREVPVMVALDPELGIGYGNMENSMLDDPFLSLLASGKVQTSSKRGKEDTLAYLLQQLLIPGCGSIDLEQIKRPEKLANMPLPNSVPVLCRGTGEYLEIHHIGGCTTTSLLGRFTPAVDQLYQHAKSIAEAEQLANSNVLLFDIDYSVGTVVDNVNRRKKIYRHNLSLLTFNPEADLQINDLYVSVRSGTLVLRSLAYNKQLIPRMASAYNYQNSDLPLFRLLCDLQHQGIHKNLYLRLRDRFPDQHYYPRVFFRNIILSPQTWLLSMEDLKAKSSIADVDSLKKHLQNIGVPYLFQTGIGDQTLTFSSQKSEDLIALLYILDKNKKLYLEEKLSAEGQHVKDADGQPYETEYLINLQHCEQLYPGYVMEAGDFSLQHPQSLLPGGTWLYYEIYCHPHRADRILLDALHPLILEHRQHISKWFFIRYQQGGQHIRFRIMLSQPSLAGFIIASLNDLFQPYVDSGLVADVKLCTYKREAERYGKKYLSIIEDHFSIDSNYILSLLGAGLSNDQKYSYAMQFIEEFVSSPMVCPEGTKAFIEKQASAFSIEQHFQPTEFKKLNQKYRELAGRQNCCVNTVQLIDLAKNAANILLHYPTNKRSEIIASLIHMHINRMFNCNQRLHEAIIYYLLLKKLKVKSLGEIYGLNPV